MLQEIIDELKTPESERKDVPHADVRKWMASEDTDTLGATYVFLSKAEHVKRVIPPFRSMKYLILCCDTTNSA